VSRLPVRALTLVVILWVGAAAAKPDPACTSGCKADRTTCLSTASADFSAQKTACPGAGPTRKSCVRAARAAFKQAKKTCQQLRKTTCLPCCKTGGTGCSGLPTTTTSTTSTLTPSVAVAITSGDVTTTLGTTSDLALTLTSQSYAGGVTLSAEGLPASWVGTFDPPGTIDLAANGTAYPTLHVAVPSNGEATTATITVRATPTGPAGPPETATAGIIVQNEFVIVIAAGTGTGDHHFPLSTLLRPGTRLTWRNDDTTVPHIIHGNGFIPHQADGPGLGYSVVLPDPGQDTYYCHSHGTDTGVGAITVSQ